MNTQPAPSRPREVILPGIVVPPLDADIDAVAWTCRADDVSTRITPAAPQPDPAPATKETPQGESDPTG